MVDFSTLVLAPAMDAFAKPVTITPKNSQPLARPYLARGVWTVTDVSIITENGGTLSSRSLKLGIRLGEFAAMPQQGDIVSTAVRSLPLGYWQGDIAPDSNLDLLVDDMAPDGQGGCTLILKRVTA